MTSRIQRFSFKLYDNLSHFYLYPWPIRWDSDYKSINWNHKAYTSYVAFSLTLFLDMFCVFCSAYVVIGYFSFRKDLQDMNIGYAMLIASAGMGVFVSVVVWKSFCASSECIQGFNQMIQFRGELFEELSIKQKLTTIDFLFPLVAFVAWVTPIAVLVISIAFNVDPIYFLM